MMNPTAATDRNFLMRQLISFQQLRERLLSDALEPATLAKLMAYELDIARVANALQHQQSGAAQQGTRRQHLHALQNLVTLALAGAMCTRQTGGDIHLELSDRACHCRPGAGALDLPLWLDALFAALALRDDAAVALLANVDLVNALAEAPAASRVGNEAFWLPMAHTVITALKQALNAIPAATETLVEQVETCTRLMRQSNLVDPACLASVDVPLLELLAGLTLGSPERWQHGWRRALRSFCNYYQHPDNQALLPGHLPLGLTALVQLARRLDLPLAEITAPVPKWLVNGDTHLSSATQKVIYHYPRRAILSANEAHWFLDLRGFPREGRQHELVTDQAQVFARYQACHSAEIAKAVAEFALLDVADLAQLELSPPLAVDAGELLFLAESFSDHQPAKRELLVDAIACINSAIARIFPGQDAIDAQTLHSREGQTLYQQEPGRFRRDRLEAYRGGLQQALRELDSGDSPAQSAPDSSDAPVQLQQALETLHHTIASPALELIRSEVDVIIDQLGKDHSGEWMRQLEPRSEDYDKLFKGEAVTVARKYYQQLWQQGIRMQYPTAEHRIESHPCPAGFLAQDTLLNKDFPAGFRAIAPWLEPSRVWVAWRYLKPGANAGINYDGLVFVNDHWVWLPKPYRALAALVAGKP